MRALSKERRDERLRLGRAILALDRLAVLGIGSEITCAGEIVAAARAVSAWLVTEKEREQLERELRRTLFVAEVQRPEIEGELLTEAERVQWQADRLAANAAGAPNEDRQSMAQLVGLEPSLRVQSLPLGKVERRPPGPPPAPGKCSSCDAVVRDQAETCASCAQEQLDNERADQLEAREGWRNVRTLERTSDGALYYLAGRQGVTVPPTYNAADGLDADTRARIIADLTAPEPDAPADQLARLEEGESCPKCGGTQCLRSIGMECHHLRGPWRCLNAKGGEYEALHTFDSLVRLPDGGVKCGQCGSACELIDFAETYEQAFAEGITAARAGESKKANPYELGNPVGAGWYCGWTVIGDRPGYVASSAAHAGTEVPPSTVDPSALGCGRPAKKSQTGRVFAVVACSKSKAGYMGAKPPLSYAARDLYTGPLFKLARHEIEARIESGEVAGWWILSALHCLVAPSDLLGPYDVKMQRGGAGRDAWAAKVAQSLLESGELHPGDVLELHAGKDYTPSALIVALDDAGIKLRRIGEGLGYGKRRAEYGRRALDFGIRPLERAGR